LHRLVFLAESAQDLSMRGFLIVVALLIQSVPRAEAPSEHLWVAFRYNQNLVISYVRRLQDPIRITMSDLKSRDLVKNPINPDGSCGYLLPLTEQRLRTFVPDPEKVSDPMEAAHRVIKTNEFLASPMGVEEAIMQMDLMNNDFYVFTNSTTSEMNVVYRRKDGHYGLIEASGAPKR